MSINSNINPDEFNFDKKGSFLDIDLEKRNISQAIAELSWSTPAGSSPVDLDLMALITVSSDGKQVIPSKEAFVFYNNKKTPKGSVSCPIDSQDGASEAVDEYILFDFDKLDVEFPDWTAVDLVIYAQPDRLTKEKRTFRSAINGKVELSASHGGKKQEVLVNLLLESKPEYENANLIVVASLSRDLKKPSQIKVSTIFDAYDASLKELISNYI